MGSEADCAAAIISSAAARRSASRSGRHSPTWRALRATAIVRGSPCGARRVTASALSGSVRSRDGE